MKDVTEQLIKDFKIMKLHCDFMGYKVDRKNNLSFHHLIVPHRDCKDMGLGEGYLYWNGVILRQDTAHDYLHIIERVDPEIFFKITSEMLDMKVLNRLDIENLRKIKDLLEYFEKEHEKDKNKKGKSLIKREYITGRVIQ